MPRLVIDLSGLDFCGVSGARLLQTAVTRSVVTGQQVAIVHSAAVARVLDATGLSCGLPLRTQADLDIEQAERGLRGYAHRVAVALGSGPESTVSELEPDPSIYIALGSRSGAYPDDDAALVWTDLHGWAVAVEDGRGMLLVLDYFGADLLPAAPEVARFTEEVLARTVHAEPSRPPETDRSSLYVRLHDYRPQLVP